MSELTVAEVITNDRLCEVGRKAVEDELVEMRDGRIFMIFRANGLVVYEPDGAPSSTIRFGMEHALKIALRAILDEPEPESPSESDET